MVLAACNDDITSIGSSLVTDKSEIVVDSAFTVAGYSVPTGELRARSLSQLIGSIQARRYGALSSDYVTQLMPSSDFDTTAVYPEGVDSLILLLRFYGDKITGDSMVPMGVNIYPLTRQLPDILTSDFDPTGYYSPEPLASAIYSATNLYSDSLEHFSVHLIQAHLPVELGQEFVRQYRANPTAFQSPLAFADLFPGLYVANSFGSGRITNIFNTRVQIHYHTTTKVANSSGVEVDSTRYYTDVIAASTPEVLTNNNLRFTIDPELTTMSAAEPILVAPIGYDVNINIPIASVINSFNRGTTSAMGVVNSLTLQIPAEEITNDYDIEPPYNLLLIPTKDRDKFFANQQVADDETSFLAQYDSTNKQYIFDGLRAYMMHIMKGNYSAAEVAEMSNFSLVPVEVTTETYTNSYYQEVTVITAIGPYTEGPAMARLLLDQAKLKLTYSTETINY